MYMGQSDRLLVQGYNYIVSARDLKMSCATGVINITTVSQYKDAFLRSVRDMNITSSVMVSNTGSAFFLADINSLGNGRFIFDGAILQTTTAYSIAFFASRVQTTGLITCPACHLLFSPSAWSTIFLGQTYAAERDTGNGMGATNWRETGISVSPKGVSTLGYMGTFDFTPAELALLRTNTTLTIGGSFAVNVAVARPYVVEEFVHLL